MIRSAPGTLLFGGALLVHAALSLWTALGRRSLRLPAWQWLQVGLGILIPVLLLPHIVNTRVSATLFGVVDSYPYELAHIWPATFVEHGVLLLFDTAAALAFAVLTRRSQDLSWRAAPTSGRAFGLLLLGLVLAYLPLLFVFGPSRWVSLGPLAVQASRIGLYGVSFAVGVLLGSLGVGEDKAPLRAALVRRWSAWATLATAAGVVLVGTQVARLRLGDTLPGWASLGTNGLALATFCAASCVAAPAVCLRFAGRRSRVWDSLAASSFGIYLLHYPVVTWVQFGLLHTSLGAVGKASVTFAAALMLSWALSALPWRAAGTLSRASLPARGRGP